MAIPSVVSGNPSGKPFHEGGDAVKIGPTQSSWHSLSFILGGTAVVLSLTILTEKKIDMIRRQRGCNKAISLNSPFQQQSDQCSRKERFCSKNLLESEWCVKKEDK